MFFDDEKRTTMIKVINKYRVHFKTTGAFKATNKNISTYLGSILGPTQNQLLYKIRKVI